MAVMKFKSSSLIETIVAMLVLVLVFLFSVMIVNNVMQTASLGAKTKARIHMYQLLSEAKQKKTFIDERIKVGNYTIDKHVFSVPDNDRLLLLDFVLEDEKGVVLYHIKEQVVAEQK